MQIDLKQVEDAAKELYIRALKVLPPDIKEGFTGLVKRETNATGQSVLATMIRNIAVAESTDNLLCQDTGLPIYNVDGNGAYPAANTGVFAVTANAADMGRFRAPTLRNIAVTAPYMHDGSVATLEETLDHYAAGGRRIAAGPNAGDGSRSPLRSELVQGFALSNEERADVVAFLRALTDETLLRDPRFADPFGRE